MYIGIDKNGQFVMGTLPNGNKRAEKGQSTIQFLENYTVVDLETTGFSPVYDDIIEMCAIKVRNNIVVDKFCSLVNNASSIIINSFIENLTGITQKMIDDAPDINNVLPEFVRFIGSDVIVGHNVSFDINFIYDASLRISGTPLTNNYVDTMRIFRKMHPELVSHRLIDMCAIYGVKYEGAHHSEQDCKMTKACYDALSSEVLQKFDNHNAFINTFKSHHSRSLKSRDIVPENVTFDESHILYGKVCVFTGTLERMTRKEAMQIVANLGGINADSVTKKTNYLILGSNDYLENTTSNKYKRAEELLLSGSDISIIPEDVFYEMIETEPVTYTSESMQQTKQDSATTSNIKPFYESLQDLLNEIIESHNLPLNSIHLYSNISTKGKNAGKETSKSICIFEPEYPPRNNSLETPGKNFTIMNIKKTKENYIELRIRNEQFQSVDTPATAVIKTLKSDQAFVRTIFKEGDESIYKYIKQNVLYCLANYESSSNFGCCSRFIECSDAKKCVHENKIYSMGCKYRKNLEAGRIFYGKNRNID